MTNRTCSMPGCTRPHRARGYCKACFARERRNGRLPHIVRPSREERFWSHVDKSGHCWVWTAQILQGYGHFKHSVGKNVLAHRFSWELIKGPIPDGYELDHICHNRACVNPDHLRTATRKQNTEHHQGAMRTSKSGVRGVHWATKANKWCAQVGHNGHVRTVGHFSSIVEAEAAVIQARIELHTRNDRDRELMSDGSAA